MLASGFRMTGYLIGIVEGYVAGKSYNWLSDSFDFDASLVM